MPSAAARDERQRVPVRSIQWIPLGVSTLLLLAPAEGWGHGQSKSVAEVVLDGRRAEVRVTIAEHDLREGLEALDPTRAGRLSARDLDAIGAHVREGTTLAIGDGRACAAERVDVAPSGDPVVEVTATVVLRCPEAPGEYRLELGYLPRLVPPHVTLAVIAAGDTRTAHTFSPEARRLAGRAPETSRPTVLAAAVLAAVAAGAALTWRRRSSGM